MLCIVLKIYNKQETIDTTNIKYANNGGYLFQNWFIKNIMIVTTMVKYKKFIKSTKTNSPTGNSGATSLPPIGNSFMSIETNSNE